MTKKDIEFTNKANDQALHFTRLAASGAQNRGTTSIAEMKLRNALTEANNQLMEARRLMRDVIVTVD